jgi:hypothetical protein
MSICMPISLFLHRNGDPAGSLPPDHATAQCILDGEEDVRGLSEFQVVPVIVVISLRRE